MRKLILASALALAAASPAFAQGAAGSGAGGAGDAAQTTGAVPAAPSAAQQRVIREYWLSARPAPTVLPSGVNVSTGDSIPDAVELRPFPNDLGMTQYRYIVVGEQLYLVNPTTRRVVHVIQ